MTDPTRYRIFARHFVLLLDTAKAAVEIGYSPNGAAQTAHKLLKHPVVQREIEKLRARHERRLDRKLDHVLDELDKLAFSNMADYSGLLGAEVPVAHLRTMDPEEAASIEGLTIDERMDENGKKHRRIKIKLHDKRAALTDLGCHLGSRRQALGEPAPPSRTAADNWNAPDPPSHGGNTGSHPVGDASISSVFWIFCPIWSNGASMMSVGPWHAITTPSSPPPANRCRKTRRLFAAGSLSIWRIPFPCLRLSAHLVGSCGRLGWN